MRTNLPEMRKRTAGIVPEAFAELLRDSGRNLDAAPRIVQMFPKFALTDAAGRRKSSLGCKVSEWNVAAGAAISEES